jgi:hypothetical protein
MLSLLDDDDDDNNTNNDMIIIIMTQTLNESSERSKNRRNIQFWKIRMQKQISN